MAMVHWRRFQFFEKKIVPPKETKQEIDYENAQTDIRKLVIKCSTSGKGRLILGDADGFINFVDRDFENVSSFRAYERSVTNVYQVKNNMLVTIGDDEETGLAPTVKIWNLDKLDKDENPTSVRTIKIQQKSNPVPVTCMAVSDDFSQIAVGLCNGFVVLMKGDLIRDKTVRQILLQPEEESPVTGLHFKQEGKDLVLFAITSDSVSVYFTNSKQLHKEVLDNIGCGIDCSVLTDEGDLIVGRKEAIYYFNTEGRGPCFGFEEEKSMLTWFHSYLIVVGQDPNNLKFNTFNIYDLKNKFIAFTESRFQSITQVVSEWNTIFVLTGDGKIFQLEEKDTQTKLETLFKKNLYSVAINLAQSQNLDYASIIDIFRRYGDHLYSKGDYDGAITQYIRTIGRLEPSYVIRKFLDAQRIHNLTLYLQSLHEKGFANADHTTLLLNCYTKLKAVEKLNEFLRPESQLKFEVKTAIQACRQAGYYEHALDLAKRHNDHDWHLKILLEDLKSFNRALDYIETLEFEEAEDNMKKYGKILVTNLPQETTKFLMKLCTGYTPKDSEFSNQTPPKASPDEFIHIFVNQPEWLAKFLEFVKSKGASSPLLYNTLLELYLRNEEVSGQSTENSNHKSERAGDEVIKRENREKALHLLRQPGACFDENHALVLCKMHDFGEGLLELYEKIGLYEEIMEYYMEHNAHAKVIECCKNFGSRSPNLWVDALSYFAGKDKGHEKEITDILENIDQDNLLPPLIVVQILSQKPTASLSLIKSYITRRLQAENQSIKEDQKQIQKYQEETTKMKNEISELKTSARVFQSNKCSGCSGALELPAIHFLCMHSFHQRCLGENESECPICTPENKKILEIKRGLEEQATKHDPFFKQLKESVDGFTVVSEYFGKGIIDKPKQKTTGGASFLF